MKKYELYRAERNRGLTYQQIADKYGVSRQRVHQVCHAKPRVYFTEKRCVYSELRNWLNEKKINATKLSVICECPLCTVRRFLNGTTKRVSVSFINKLMALTGLTYEELFEV